MVRRQRSNPTDFTLEERGETRPLYEGGASMLRIVMPMATRPQVAERLNTASGEERAER